MGNWHGVVKAMRRLNQYVGGTVMMATLGSLVFIVFIFFISMMIGELQDLKGGYTLNKALFFVLWQVPNMVYENLTFAAFLGCIIGLGIHADANELVIIRSAGVSMTRLLWAVMRPVLLLMVIGIFIGEYIAPISLQLSEGVKASAKTESVALKSGSGLWYIEDSNFYHFNGLNKKLYGITQYQLDQKGMTLKSTGFAEGATYIGKKWQLEEGKKSRFVTTVNDDGEEVRTIEQDTFSRKTWDTELTPKALNDLVLPTEALSIKNLYRYAKSRDQQGLESQQFWLSFWQKISQPFVMISLALVGVSFIFGSLRESTMGFRLTVALLTGIVFNICQNFLAASSLVFNFSPLLAVAVPIATCCLIGGWMLQRR